MKYSFTLVLQKEDKWYIARALELGVVSQGKTIEEATANIKEAVELFLEDQPISKKELKQRSTPLVTTMAVEYA